MILNEAMNFETEKKHLTEQYHLMMEESQALYQEWNPSDEGYRQKARELAQDLHSVASRLGSTLAAVVVHIGESFNPE